MTTAQPEISFVIAARDKATGQFAKVSQSSGKLGTVWRSLAAIAGRLNVTFLALSLALPIVGAAFAGLITQATGVGLLRFERASRRARVQLQLLGFSAISARDQVQALTNLMDRSSATSILTSAEAINDVAAAGAELTAQLAPLAKTFGDVIGADPGLVFSGLFDIVAHSDPTKFARLVTGMEKLVIPVKILDQIEAGFNQPFFDWLEKITSSETLSGLERLQEDLERIANITRPAREAILLGTAGVVDVFMESLASQLERAQGRIKGVFTAAFAIAVFAPIGRGIGRRIGLGVMAGLGGIILLNIKDTIDDAINAPVVFGQLILISWVLGRTLGGKGGIIGGLVFIIGLELLPGLQEVFSKLSTPAQAGVIAFVLGTALGLATKQGFLKAFAIGSILKTAVESVMSGNSILDNAVIIAYTALGAALGGLIAGRIGAIVGASLGQIAGDFLISDAAARAFRDAGKAMGKWLLEGMKDWVENGIIAIINDIIKAFNKIPFMVDIPLVPQLPRPVPPSPMPHEFLPRYPGYSIVPVPIPSSFGTSASTGLSSTSLDMLAGQSISGLNATQIATINAFNASGRIQSLGEGGIVEGPLGAPKLAIVHGGERVFPGGPVIVQLVLDKRVIGEVAIDAFNRTARFNAGMVPGSIGS